MLVPAVASVAVPALTFTTLAGVPFVHHQYPAVWPGSTAGVALPGPDVPHLPEPGGTYYTPWYGAGTTVPTSLAWDPRWYNPYGPNFTGD